MTSATADASSRALRRAAAATGLSAGLFVPLLLLDLALDRSRAASLATDGWGELLPAATAGLVLVVLVPVAVRLLARPPAQPIPPRAETAVLIGLASAIGLLFVGLTALTVGRLADVSALGPPWATQALVPALAWLVLVSGGSAATQLYRAGMLSPSGADVPPTAPPAPSRPDLFDDLATLAARALPGSAVARGVAWLNRGLDRWPWSPRCRRTAAAPGTPAPSTAGSDGGRRPVTTAVAPRTDG